MRYRDDRVRETTYMVSDDTSITVRDFGIFNYTDLARGRNDRESVGAFKRHITDQSRSYARNTADIA